MKNIDINWENFLKDLHEDVNALRRAYEDKTNELTRERNRFENSSHCNFGYFELAQIFAQLMSKFNNDFYQVKCEMENINNGCGTQPTLGLKISVLSDKDSGISFPTISLARAGTLLLIEGFDMFTSNVCWNKKIENAAFIEEYPYLMKFLNVFVLEQYIRERKLSFEEALVFVDQYVKEHTNDLSTLTKNRKNSNK